METSKWAIDNAHSEIQFKVKHLVISTVTGQFKSFTGSIEAENDSFENARVSLEVDLTSVDTNQADRDNHLRSEDFFAVERFPKMTFSGVYTQGKLKGELSIKGTSKEISLDVDFNGIAKDPWGNTKAGFEVSGTINRKDFGLAWNAITEAGGMLVAEDVKIIANVQFAKA